MANQVKKKRKTVKEFDEISQLKKKSLTQSIENEDRLKFYIRLVEMMAGVFWPGNEQQKTNRRKFSITFDI